MSTATSPYISFDRIADRYESTRYIPPAVLSAAAALIRSDLDATPAIRVLDVGSGTGRFTRSLAAAGLTCVGADISLPMLREARAHESRAELVRADARALPFKDASFAAVLVVHLLHLVADWQTVLGEIRRVLVPAGRLYLGSESGRHFPSRSLYFQAAADLGLLRPNLGAQSLETVLKHAAALGATVTQIDRSRLKWTAQSTVSAMLETLRNNPFSHMWHLDAAAHARLMREVERRFAATYRDMAAAERANASIAVWRVEWPSYGNR